MDKKFKILFAEDEPSLREIMVELLEEEGFECDSASNGAEAKYKMSQKKYDLLITDFMMPEMNGSQLFYWCRTHDIKIPVIFLSGYMDQLMEEDIPLDDYSTSILEKPVDFDYLLAAMDKASNHQLHL